MMNENEIRDYLQQQTETIRGVAATFSEKEGADILRAYDFASRAHSGQMRKSGEPYIMHPVAVAVIIEQMGLDAESVMAGLLHDTVEDTSVTREDIAREFGAPVAMLVDGSPS